MRDPFDSLDPPCDHKAGKRTLVTWNEGVAEERFWVCVDCGARGSTWVWP